MPTKFLSFVVGFWLSLFVSAALSVAAPVMNRQALTPQGFFTSFAIATVVATIVSFVLPVAKWGNMFANGTGAKADTAAARLLSAAIPASVMLAVLAFVLLALQTGFGIVGGFSFIDRWVGAFLSLWPVVYLAIVLVQPACVWLGLKLVKRPFMAIDAESV